MNKGIKIFLAFFALVCTENVFQAIAWTADWTEPTEEQSSSLALAKVTTTANLEAMKQASKERMQSAGPGLLCQSLFCLIAMTVNNVLWVRRGSFVYKWHILHYYSASALLVLYLPRKAWWPAMTGAKYLLTAMNIFIFQVLLGKLARVTTLHKLLIATVTMVCLVLETRNWVFVADDALSIWDGILHMTTPALFAACLSYISIKNRLGRDMKAVDEFEAIKKVLGSLSQGVALTVDFPTAVKAA